MHCQRFFHQNMDASLKGVNADRRVIVVGCGDDDAVQSYFFKHVAVIVEGRHLKLGGILIGALGNDIAHRGQLGIGQASGDILDMRAAHHTHAYHSQADFGCGFGYSFIFR